ncbi:hypothetical protein JK228_24845, partial [Serratia rubidaea]|nr:hypothetical protein [Serratia rubidaea]
MPLSPETVAIKQMRAAKTVEEADAVNSQVLSAAARQYTLGAVAFAARDPRAADYFHQVLALPDTEQGAWGLRARYSLGRLLMNDYGTPEDANASVTPARPDAARLQQALAAFQQVIDRVKSGGDDPDQLALSSLGQQARIHFWLGDIKRAAHLYAQQAAQGDAQGGQSLQYVASYLVDPQHFEQLKTIAADPLVQQLVTVELFARSSNLQAQDDGSTPPRSQQVTQRLLTLLDSETKSGFNGSDRLAALAYRADPAFMRQFTGVEGIAQVRV